MFKGVFSKKKKKNSNDDDSSRRSGDYSRSTSQPGESMEQTSTPPELDSPASSQLQLPPSDPQLPSSAATHDPQPPSSAATHDPQPPSSAATHDPQPPSSAATRDPQPPSSAATHDPQPPSGAAPPDPKQPGWPPYSLPAPEDPARASEGQPPPSWTRDPGRPVAPAEQPGYHSYQSGNNSGPSEAVSLSSRDYSQLPSSAMDSNRQNITPPSAVRPPPVAVTNPLESRRQSILSYQQRARAMSSAVDPDKGLVMFRDLADSNQQTAGELTPPQPAAQAAQAATATTPLQTAPLLNGAPVLVLAGTQGFLGSTPVQYQMADSPRFQNLDGGRRVMKRREASVWLRDPSRSAEDVKDELNRLLDRGVDTSGGQQPEGYLERPRLFSPPRTSRAFCLAPPPRTPSPSTSPVSSSPVCWQRGVSPAAARRRLLQPDPEEAEEYEMERDGSPGRQLTLNAEQSGVYPGGTRVVRTRQASIWLRDRLDGSPHTLHEVEEELQRLMDTGVNRASGPQDDGRVCRKAHKRRGRSTSRRDRRAIREVPRGRSDQPSSTDSTTDDLSFDSSDEEFEERIRAAVEKILALKKRQRELPSAKRKKAGPNPYDASSEPQSSTSERPATTAPWPTERKDAAVCTDQHQPPETETKAAELLTQMCHLQTSMAELLQCKAGLQDNVTQLLQSKASLQNNLQELQQQIQANAKVSFRPDTLSRADQTETPESNTMGSQVEFPIVEQPCDCRTGSDEKVNEAESEEGDTSSSDSTQSDNRRENAERPYSPPFQRRTVEVCFVEHCVQHGVCIETVAAHRGLAAETGQLSLASDVLSSGFELCSACGHGHCLCDQGSENNNSDRRPYSTQELSSGRLPPGAGTVSVHIRTASQWRADPSTSEDTEQLSSDSQNPLSQPLSSLESWREQSLPGQHAGSPWPREAKAGGRDPARRQLFLDEEDEPRSIPPAQVARVRGTIKSESFYESEVQKYSGTHPEERRGVMNTHAVYDEEVSSSILLPAYARAPEDTYRAQRERGGCNTYRSPAMPSKHAKSESGRPRSREKRIVAHTIRNEKTDSFTSRSCYSEGVVKSPKSHRIRSREVRCTQRTLSRSPPATRSPEKGSTLQSTLDQNSSSDGPERPLRYDQLLSSSIGRSSPPRQRRRASLPHGAVSGRSPLHTRSPNSPGYSCVSRHSRVHSAGGGNFRTNVSPGRALRSEDKGRWGSHSSTRDTMSPNRLPDQILFAAEERITSRCTARSQDSEGDQESLSPFSRAMQRGASLDRERRMYEKRTARSRTSPKPCDALEMDRPGTSNGSPQKEHTKSRPHSSPGVGHRPEYQERNASPSPSFRSPRSLKENLIFRHESSWDTFTSSGKRLPPPVSDKEINTLKRRCPVQEQTETPDDSSTSNQDGIEKPQETDGVKQGSMEPHRDSGGFRQESKETPPESSTQDWTEPAEEASPESSTSRKAGTKRDAIKKPKRHDCLCQQYFGSTSPRGGSLLRQVPRESAATPEADTCLFSCRPAPPPYVVPRDGPHRDRRSASASPTGRRARSVAPTKKEQEHVPGDSVTRVVRSEHSLILARYLPGEAVDPADPNFHTWQHFETELRPLRHDSLFTDPNRDLASTGVPVGRHDHWSSSCHCSSYTVPRPCKEDRSSERSAQNPCDNRRPCNRSSDFAGSYTAAREGSRQVDVGTGAQRLPFCTGDLPLTGLTSSSIPPGNDTMDTDSQCASTVVLDIVSNAATTLKLTRLGPRSPPAAQLQGCRQPAQRHVSRDEATPPPAGNDCVSVETGAAARPERVVRRKATHPPVPAAPGQHAEPGVVVEVVVRSGDERDKRGKGVSKRPPANACASSRHRSDDADREPGVREEADDRTPPSVERREQHVQSLALQTAASTDRTLCPVGEMSLEKETFVIERVVETAEKRARHEDPVQVKSPKTKRSSPAQDGRGEGRTKRGVKRTQPETRHTEEEAVLDPDPDLQSRQVRILLVENERCGVSFTHTTAGKGLCRRCLSKRVDQSRETAERAGNDPPTPEGTQQPVAPPAQVLTSFQQSHMSSTQATAENRMCCKCMCLSEQVDTSTETSETTGHGGPTQQPSPPPVPCNPPVETCLCKVAVKEIMSISTDTDTLYSVSRIRQEREWDTPVIPADVGAPMATGEQPLPSQVSRLKENEQGTVREPTPPSLTETSENGGPCYCRTERSPTLPSFSPGTPNVERSIKRTFMCSSIRSSPQFEGNEPDSTEDNAGTVASDDASARSLKKDGKHKMIPKISVQSSASFFGTTTLSHCPQAMTETTGSDERSVTFQSEEFEQVVSPAPPNPQIVEVREGVCEMLGQSSANNTGVQEVSLSVSRQLTVNQPGTSPVVSLASCSRDTTKTEQVAVTSTLSRETMGGRLSLKKGVTGSSSPPTVKNIVHHQPVSNQTFSPNTTLTLANHVYLSPPSPEGIVSHSCVKKDGVCRCAVQRRSPGFQSSADRPGRCCCRRYVHHGVLYGQPRGSLSDRNASNGPARSPSPPRHADRRFSCLHSASAGCRMEQRVVSGAMDPTGGPRPRRERWERRIGASCACCDSSGKNPCAGSSVCRRHQCAVKKTQSAEEFFCCNFPAAQETSSSSSVNCYSYLQTDAPCAFLDDAPQDYHCAASAGGHGGTAADFTDACAGPSRQRDDDPSLARNATFLGHTRAPSMTEIRTSVKQISPPGVATCCYRQGVAVLAEPGAERTAWRGPRAEASAALDTHSTVCVSSQRLSTRTSRDQADQLGHLRFHYSKKTEKLRKKIHDLKVQQKELISQVKSDCLSIVDREVQDRDAKLLEERISKAKLKQAVVALQKQLTGMEREAWRSTLNKEAAQQSLVRDKLELELHLNNVQREAVSLRAEREELTSKLEKVQEHKAALELQLTEARFNSREKEIISSQQAQELSSYRNLADVCQEKYQEQRDAATRLQVKLDEVTRRLQERDKESESLKQQLEAAKSVISKRRQQVEQLKLMHLELAGQCEKEQTLTAMAMKERKEVEDKLNLETSKYSALLAQVDRQKKHLMTVRSKVESLDPNRLRQQFEICYRTQVDLVLRRANDIMEQRAAEIAAAEMTQQEIDFRRRAHEANVQIMSQRNRQLKAMREAAAREARFLDDIRFPGSPCTERWETYTTSPAAERPDSAVMSSWPLQPSHNTPAGLARIHHVEHTHLLSHTPPAGSHSDPCKLREKEQLDMRLRALKSKVQSRDYSVSRRIHAVRAESGPYLATIRYCSTPHVSAQPTPWGPDTSPEVDRLTSTSHGAFRPQPQEPTPWGPDMSSDVDRFPSTSHGAFRPQRQEPTPEGPDMFSDVDRFPSTSHSAFRPQRQEPTPGGPDTSSDVDRLPSTSNGAFRPQPQSQPSPGETGTSSDVDRLPPSPNHCFRPQSESPPTPAAAEIPPAVDRLLFTSERGLRPAPGVHAQSVASSCTVVSVSYGFTPIASSAPGSRPPDHSPFGQSAASNGLWQTPTSQEACFFNEDSELASLQRQTNGGTSVALERGSSRILSYQNSPSPGRRVTEERFYENCSVSERGHFQTQLYQAQHSPERDDYKIQPYQNSQSSARGSCEAPPYQNPPSPARGNYAAPPYRNSPSPVRGNYAAPPYRNSPSPAGGNYATPPYRNSPSPAGGNYAAPPYRNSPSPAGGNYAAPPYQNSPSPARGNCAAPPYQNSPSPARGNCAAPPYQNSPSSGRGSYEVPPYQNSFSSVEGNYQAQTYQHGFLPVRESHRLERYQVAPFSATENDRTKPYQHQPPRKQSDVVQTDFKPPSGRGRTFGEQPNCVRNIPQSRGSYTSQFDENISSKRENESTALSHSFTHSLIQSGQIYEVCPDQNSVSQTRGISVLQTNQYTAVQQRETDTALLDQTSASRTITFQTSPAWHCQISEQESFEVGEVIHSSREENCPTLSNRFDAASDQGLDSRRTEELPAQHCPIPVPHGTHSSSVQSKSTSPFKMGGINKRPPEYAPAPNNCGVPIEPLSPWKESFRAVSDSPQNEQRQGSCKRQSGQKGGSLRNCRSGTPSGHSFPAGRKVCFKSDTQPDHESTSQRCENNRSGCPVDPTRKGFKESPVQKEERWAGERREGYGRTSDKKVALKRHTPKKCQSDKSVQKGGTLGRKYGRTQKIHMTKWQNDVTQKEGRGSRRCSGNVHSEKRAQLRAAYDRGAAKNERGSSAIVSAGRKFDRCGGRTACSIAMSHTSSAATQISSSRSVGVGFNSDHEGPFLTSLHCELLQSPIYGEQTASATQTDYQAWFSEFQESVAIQTSNDWEPTERKRQNPFRARSNDEAADSASSGRSKNRSKCGESRVRDDTRRDRVRQTSAPPLSRSRPSGECYMLTRFVMGTQTSMSLQSLCHQMGGILHSESVTFTRENIMATQTNPSLLDLSRDDSDACDSDDMVTPSKPRSKRARKPGVRSAEVRPQDQPCLRARCLKRGRGRSADAIFRGRASSPETSMDRGLTNAGKNSGRQLRRASNGSPSPSPKWKDREPPTSSRSTSASDVDGQEALPWQQNSWADASGGSQQSGRSPQRLESEEDVPLAVATHASSEDRSAHQFESEVDIRRVAATHASSKDRSAQLLESEVDVRRVVVKQTSSKDSSAHQFESEVDVRRVVAKQASPEDRSAHQFESEIDVSRVVVKQTSSKDRSAHQFESEVDVRCVVAKQISSEDRSGHQFESEVDVRRVVIAKQTSSKDRSPQRRESEVDVPRVAATQTPSKDRSLQRRESEVDVPCVAATQTSSKDRSPQRLESEVDVPRVAATQTSSSIDRSAHQLESEVYVRRVAATKTSPKRVSSGRSPHELESEVDVPHMAATQTSPERMSSASSCSTRASSSRRVKIVDANGKKSSLSAKKKTSAGKRPKSPSPPDPQPTIAGTDAARLSAADVLTPGALEARVWEMLNSIEKRVQQISEQANCNLQSLQSQARPTGLPSSPPPPATLSAAGAQSTTCVLSASTVVLTSTVLPASAAPPTPEHTVPAYSSRPAAAVHTASVPSPRCVSPPCCVSPVRCVSPPRCVSPVRCASPVPCVPPVRCASPVPCVPPVSCASPVSCVPPVSCASPLPCVPPACCASPIPCVSPDRCVSPVHCPSPIRSVSPVHGVTTFTSATVEVRNGPPPQGAAAAHFPPPPPPPPTMLMPPQPCSLPLSPPPYCSAAASLSPGLSIPSPASYPPLSPPPYSQANLRPPVPGMNTVTHSVSSHCLDVSFATASERGRAADTLQHNLSVYQAPGPVPLYSLSPAPSPAFSRSPCPSPACSRSPCPSPMCVSPGPYVEEVWFSVQPPPLPYLGVPTAVYGQHSATTGSPRLSRRASRKKGKGKATSSKTSGKSSGARVKKSSSATHKGDNTHKGDYCAQPGTSGVRTEACPRAGQLQNDSKPCGRADITEEGVPSKSGGFSSWIPGFLQAVSPSTPRRRLVGQETGDTQSRQRGRGHDKQPEDNAQRDAFIM